MGNNRPKLPSAHALDPAFFYLSRQRIAVQEASVKCCPILGNKLWTSHPALLSVPSAVIHQQQTVADRCCFLCTHSRIQRLHEFALIMVDDALYMGFDLSTQQLKGKYILPLSNHLFYFTLLLMPCPCSYRSPILPQTRPLRDRRLRRRFW
jgi:hypothetical protein